MSTVAQQFKALTQRSRKVTDGQALLSILNELITLYDQLPSPHDPTAPPIRQVFLQVLERLPSDQVDLQSSQLVAHFLAEQVKSEDFHGPHWQSPENARWAIASNQTCAVPPEPLWWRPNPNQRLRPIPRLQCGALDRRAPRCPGQQVQ